MGRPEPLFRNGKHVVRTENPCSPSSFVEVPFHVFAQRDVPMLGAYGPNALHDRKPVTPFVGRPGHQDLQEGGNRVVIRRAAGHPGLGIDHDELAVHGQGVHPERAPLKEVRQPLHLLPRNCDRDQIVPADGVPQERFEDIIGLGHIVAQKEDVISGARFLDEGTGVRGFKCNAATPAVRLACLRERKGSGR